MRGRRRATDAELTLDEVNVITITIIGIISIIIVIIVTILRSIPDVSEWKDAARLCMLRLWVSLEFIRASRVTFFPDQFRIKYKL